MYIETFNLDLVNRLLRIKKNFRQNNTKSYLKLQIKKPCNNSIISRWDTSLLQTKI